MKSRKELSQVTARRYRNAGKKGKGRILDEFVASAGYNRAYAAMLLRNYRCAKALEKLWKRFGYVCGKRLMPIIRYSSPFLPAHRSLKISPATRAPLETISAATVDGTGIWRSLRRNTVSAPCTVLDRCSTNVCSSRRM